MHPIHAAETDKWSGKISAELKAGGNQDIGTLDVFAPFWQRTDRLLFADVRVVDTSGPGVEANLGLGFRKIEKDSKYFGDEWAWGVYGFLDRRKTPNDNYFSQISGGAELFTESWSLRSSVYYPERDDYVVATRGDGTAGITLNGTSLVLQQSGLLEAREFALPGVDAEVGRRFNLGDKQELWLYGGYFYFDRSNMPEIDGPRLRAEYRKYDVFNIAGSEISIGAEVQHDDIRGTDEFIVARISIPFGMGGSEKQHRVFNNIERRMTEYVVRDKDIVSFEQDINKPVGSEGGPVQVVAGTTTAITDLVSGEQVDVFFVDATGSGTGTSVNRASADFAETNSGAGDIIVLVDDATGNITATSGLQLQNNQQLVGFASGPISLIFDASNTNLTGSNLYQITDPTGNGAATITNAGGTEVVTLADNTQVRDITITTTGAVNGIAGNGFTGATISNIAMSNAGADAFDFTNTAGTVTVTDSSATNSTGSGLRINGGNATYAFNNFDVSDTATGRSIDIAATTGGLLTFDANSAINNSGGSGVLINNIGGNVTFNGGVSITGATSDALTTTNLNANTVAFNNSLGITTAAGNGIVASNGTLNIAGTGTTINAVGGSAIDLNNVTVGNGVGGALTFASLASNGGANGIALTNVTATNDLTVTSATLAGNTTAGLNVNGVSGTLNIAATNIDTAAAGTGIAIAGANGTLNIGSGGLGLDIDGGTTGVSINQTSGTVNLGTGASGVFAVDGTSGVGVTLAGAGTVNIGTGGGTSSIGATTDTGSTAFQVTGGSVNANYAGSIALASNVGLVSVQGGHSGTLTFSGALSNSAATNATQLDFNNADGSYNFDGTVSTNTTAGTGIGLDIAATSGGTIDFDNTLTIATASGNAIQMAGTGSLDVSGGSLDVDTTTGTGLTQSAGSVTLSDTTSIRASSTGTGISASGGSLAVASGAGTAEVISASGQGIALSGVTTGTGGVTFDNVSSGGGANGIALTNVTATNGLTVTSATLAGNTTAGINVNGVSGTLNIAAANVDTAAAGTGVAIAGANGTVNVGTGGAGLDIDGGTTGVSINQTSGTVNLGTGAGGVFAVDGTSGVGVTLAGAGTVNIGTGGGTASIGTTTTTTGNAIAATGGNAIFNYTGDITNTSGRLLDVQNTTGGSVTVTGGTITDTGTGVNLQNTAGSVSLTNATISNITGSAVTGNATSNLTLDNLTVTDSATSGVAISLTNATGNVSLLNSSITYDAVGVDGLDINNSALGSGTLTLLVDNTSFTGDATVSGLANAIDVITSTTSTLNATITGSSFTNAYFDAIEIDVNGTGGTDTVTIGTSANRNTYTGVGGDVMDLSAGNNSTITFDIRGNDADGNALSQADGIDLILKDGVTTTVNIIDNTFTKIGDGTTDETVQVLIGNNAAANSTVVMTVTGNTLSNNTATGLTIDNFGSSDTTATVNNNTFSSNGNNRGVYVLTATSGTETCVSATGNTFTGDQFTLTETADGSILRVPGVVNAAALSTANSGVTVTDTNANVGFNEACTIP